MFYYFNTDVPDAVMITTTYNSASGSLLVQWNEVTDYFTVNYTVTWYNESGTVGMVTVNSPPYTVTGLTANTSYNVTVVAINTCCGVGPVSNVIVNTASTSTTPGNVTQLLIMKSIIIPRLHNLLHLCAIRCMLIC